MSTKKILGIIFSLIFIAGFAFCLSWTIINWDKVKDSMNGTQIYTHDDLQNAYQDGYDTALTDKSEYDDLINSYRDTITTQTDRISQLNSELSELNSNIRDCQTQIANLTTQKTNLETQVATLTSTKTSNETTIASLNGQITSLTQEVAELENANNTFDVQVVNLNSQIANLQNQIVELNASGDDKTSEITSLNSQIAVLENTISSLNAVKTNNENTISGLNSQIVYLQNTITQLQTTNQLNLDTISSLNTQISVLNNQINDLTSQVESNATNVSSYQQRITELENSIEYYESYIASLESGTQSIITFEFNGSVYNIQVVNNGSLVSVTEPTSTDYVQFNYWEIDGTQIDLSTYQFTESTKVVANVSYSYDVSFIIDGVSTNEQIVAENGYAVSQTSAPQKTGYQFDGWTLDGNTIINPNTYAITQNTAFVAKFTKLYNVVFMYEGNAVKTQVVRTGEYATAPTVTDTTYKIFNGWKVNNAYVDLSNYKINSNTTFTADITYKYDVIFKVDGSTYNSQIITKNSYASVPNAPVKTGYVFDGWTTNGTDIVNVATTNITANTTFIAKFTIKTYTVNFVKGGSTISTQTIDYNSYATAPTVSSTDYAIFNGWKVNGALVDISEYAITQNTTFVADITNKYNVVFKVGTTVVDTQIIAENGHATAPTNPSVEGYLFNGWTLNGTDVINVSDYNITMDTTFIANVTNYYVVNFVSNGAVISTQNIVENGTPTLPNNPTKYGYIFDGWTVNGNLATSYVITSDTTFTAKFSIHAGIYKNGTMVKSWADLVSEGTIDVSGTTITQCNDEDLEGDLVFDSNITCIKYDAFRGCWKLTSLKFLDDSKLGVIEDGAFENCMEIKSIDFGSGSLLHDMGYTTFRNCSSLTSIVIPKEVTYIGNYCFYECYSLTSVTFADDCKIAWIGTDAFGESSITSIVIPQSCTSIDEYAFEYCCDLTTVYINSTQIAYLSSGEDICLLEYATTVYLRQGCSTRLVLNHNFIKAGSSGGYDIYTLTGTLPRPTPIEPPEPPEPKPYPWQTIN